MVCALAGMPYAPSRAQSSPAHGPVASTSENIAVQVFQPPQLKHSNFYVRVFGAESPPPDGAWVTLSMMVDPNGKPFEVAVVDSSGDENVNEAVVEGIERARFVPGSLDGKPIESSYEFRFRTAILGVQEGVSLRFRHAVKLLTAAIQAKDRSAADAAIKKAKIENGVEDAYFALATYQYAQVWGDETEQLGALQRAIGWMQYENLIPKNVVAETLQADLLLELKTHEYAEAIATWKQLQKLGVDPGTVAKVMPVMQKLDQLRQDHHEVEVSGQLYNGSWYLQLFKPQFRIEVTNGFIADVKLRCQKRYLQFTFDPKLQYEVSGNSGDCSIQLEGKDGTQFNFIEF